MYFVPICPFLLAWSHISTCLKGTLAAPDYFCNYIAKYGRNHNRVASYYIVICFFRNPNSY